MAGLIAAVVNSFLVLAASADLALAPIGSTAWRALEFPRIARHTEYTQVEIDGHDAVRSISDCAASALYLPLMNVDLAVTPRLRWEWWIEQGLSIADERRKDGDDFAARMYVMFRYMPEQANIWQRLRRAIAERLYGAETPGSSINYVWASTQPPGARWDNPYATEAKMVALGSGAMEGWRREEVDVLADYRAFFNQEPPPVVGIAIMTDSDNTCQRAVAYFANPRFLGSAAAGVSSARPATLNR